MSTLLSNVALNDLDHWIADQWEFFPLSQPHKTRSGELYTKKRTLLKEGYMVRYADDFKVICRDFKTAYTSTLRVEQGKSWRSHQRLTYCYR